MKSLQFEYCPTCGNLIEKIEDQRVPLMCCGKKLEALTPNTTEAAIEKHLPVIKITDQTLTVEVAEVTHPSLASHWIPWVVIQTPTLTIRQEFKPGETPTVILPRPEAGTPVRAYAYCNLHGLWMSETIC